MKNRNFIFIYTISNFTQFPYIWRFSSKVTCRKFCNMKSPFLIEYFNNVCKKALRTHIQRKILKKNLSCLQAMRDSKVSIFRFFGSLRSASVRPLLSVILEVISRRWCRLNLMLLREYHLYHLIIIAALTVPSNSCSYRCKLLLCR